MKNTTKTLKRTWTGPIDTSGDFYLAEMGKINMRTDTYQRLPDKARARLHGMRRRMAIRIKPSLMYEDKNSISWSCSKTSN